MQRQEQKDESLIETQRLQPISSGTRLTRSLASVLETVPVEVVLPTAKIKAVTDVKTSLLPTLPAKDVRKSQLLQTISTSQWALCLVVILQAALTLITLQNTAFQDEALYLFAGREILHSWSAHLPVAEHYGLYFSGYPSFYPVIGGYLDMLGGLELARLFSLVCMIGVTLCVYYITKKLFSRESAIIAAALFAFQGPVLFLCRLATYDALCLFLLAAAVACSIHTSYVRKPWSAALIGPLLLLAVLAKYAGLLFVPSIVLIFLIQNMRRRGLRGTLLRFVLTLVALVCCIVVFAPHFDRDVLTGLSFTTTNRTAFIRTPAWTLIQTVLTLGGIGFLLGFICLLFDRWWQTSMKFVLFGTALLAPAYHIYKGESVSLDKHVAFSLFFLMPLAGYIVARIAKYQPQTLPSYRWLAGIACCLIVFALGIQQSQTLYHDWAPSNGMATMLETQVRYGSGRYLAEDYDVCRYDLQAQTAPWQWSSLDFFQYTNKDHQLLTGIPAYKAALNDGYFDVIELSFGYNASLAVVIRQAIQTGGHYVLVGKVPYQNSYGTGDYWVWRKKT